MEVYNAIKKDIAIMLVLFILISMVFDYTQYKYDDTDDRDNSRRSGLMLYKDYGTGIEYVSDGNTMVKRGENKCIKQ